MSIWSTKEFEQWVKSETAPPDVLYLSADKSISSEQATIITTLQTLEYLKMYSYIGKSLPSNFAMLGNLVFLTITSQSEDESFDSFPEEIYQLTKLQHLKISGHRFAQIDTEIGNLQELRTVDFSRNLIRNIPDSFSSLERLQKVNLSGNVNINMNPILAIDSLYSLDLRCVDTIMVQENAKLPHSLAYFVYGQSMPDFLKDMWAERSPEIDYPAFQATMVRQLQKEALQVMQEELDN
jgi:hypothetical protein